MFCARCLSCTPVVASHCVKATRHFPPIVCSSEWGLPKPTSLPILRAFALNWMPLWRLFPWVLFSQGSILVAWSPALARLSPDDRWGAFATLLRRGGEAPEPPALAANLPFLNFLIVGVSLRNPAVTVGALNCLWTPRDEESLLRCSEFAHVFGFHLRYLPAYESILISRSK
jgi:hypothetical protein